MTSSQIVDGPNGQPVAEPGQSLELWKIKSRAYFYAQRIVDRRIDFRDAVMSGYVRAKLDPDKDIKDSFLNHNLSIGYTEYYPLKEFLRKKREEHQKSLDKNG